MIFILSIVLAVTAFFVWPISAGKSRRGDKAYQPAKKVSLLGSTVFTAIAVLQCFTQIPAGNVGVVDLFGIVSEETLHSGIDPVNPMANLIKVSIQTQEHKESMQVLSREGLTIGLEVSALYTLNPDSAARVYQTVAGGTTKPLF